MEITYQVSGYLSSTFRHDAGVAGKAPGSDDEGALDPAQGDRVEISRQGRRLQRILSGAEESGRERHAECGKDKGGLTSHIDGEERKDDGRIAYGGADAAGADSGGESVDAKIRELQILLRDAMKRLQQARQELAAAQSRGMEEARAARNGETPSEMSGIEQERDMARQKVVAAQAEVNSIQEQLQKTLNEKNKEARSLGAGPSVPVGGTWEPQGTNDYIGGNW